MKSTFVKLIKWTFAVYVVLFSIIWLASGLIIKHLSEQPLLQQGFTLKNDSSITFNPFILQLKADNIAISPKGQQQASFTLESLTIDLSLWPLFSKVIEFDEITLSGLKTSISQVDDKITIAGKTIPASNENTAQQAARKENTTTAWQVKIPAATFEDIDLNVLINEKSLEIELQEIVLSKLIANSSSLNADTSLTALINKTVVTLSASTSKQNDSLNIELATKVDTKDISRFSDFLTPYQTTGSMSLNLNSSVEINGDAILIKSDDIAFLLKDIEVQDNDYLASVKALDFSLTSLLINKDAQDISLTADSNLVIQNTAVSAQDSKQLLTSLGSIKLDDITTELNNKEMKLSWQSFIVDEANFLNALSGEPTPTASFNQLDVAGGTVQNDSIQLGAINLNGLKSNLTIEADKSIANLPKQSTGKSASETTEVKVKAEQQKQQQPLIELSGFTLTDEATLHIVDKSVSPNYEETVVVKSFDISRIDSNRPDLVSTAKAEILFDEYSALNAHIDMKPFAEIPVYDVSAKLKEMSLHKISPYIQDAMQHSIKSGQLAIDIKTLIKGNKIDGSADIHVAAFDLSSANDVEVDTLKDQTAIPLSAALGLLKDSDGNIEIELPITGDINDPSFGLSGFATLLVKRATMMAAKDYLMTTFVPYANVVTIAMAAGEHLLKVRLNDLPYKPKETTLTDSQLLFATELTQLIKDNDDLRITLCAIGVPEDTGLANGEKIEDKEKLSELLTISNLRSKQFKQHLVSNGVASERIIQCAAEIDFSTDAKPRLTFAT